MGAALKLRRAARDAVDAGARPFLYAHPNDRMLPVHLKAGHAPLGRMLRYAKPLHIRTGWHLADSVGSAALRFAGGDVLVRQTQDVQLVVSAVGSEFDDLYERADARLGTALVRDAAYVTWRFQRLPADKHEIVITRRDSVLTGYLAFSVRDRVAHLKDWLTVDNTSRDQLFAGFIREMRQTRHRESVRDCARNTS